MNDELDWVKKNPKKGRAHYSTEIGYGFTVPDTNDSMDVESYKVDPAHFCQMERPIRVDR